MTNSWQYNNPSTQCTTLKLLDRTPLENFPYSNLQYQKGTKGILSREKPKKITVIKKIMQ